jgi:hypothetical protein
MAGYTTMSGPDKFKLTQVVSVSDEVWDSIYLNLEFMAYNEARCMNGEFDNHLALPLGPINPISLGLDTLLP